MLVKQEFIKDLIDRNIVEFKYLRTQDMPADMGTKPITGQQLIHFINKLDMYRL
jgi:hypothetical protein